MCAMLNSNEIYEQLCANLKIPIDSKIVRTLMDVESNYGELNIAGLSVTSQTCEVLSKVLSQCKDITKLNMGDCLLPAQGLATLLTSMHMTHVHTLQLRGNNIAGPSVHKLSKMMTRCSNIKNLGLEWNNLGLCTEGMAEFCRALAGSRGLEALDLRNNQLDEGCAALLAEALRTNTSLRALDLRWNSMEQVGGQHFLSALQSNKTLTTLRLQGNSISNELLNSIEQCVQHNLSLLKLQSGYEARKEFLASQVQSVNQQRAEELRLWVDKSQKQVNEMDAKLKEMHDLVAIKQQEIKQLGTVITERTQEKEEALRQIRTLQDDLKLRDDSNAAVLRDYQLQIDTLNKALAANKTSLSSLTVEMAEERRQREIAEQEFELNMEKMKHLETENRRRKEELQSVITDHIAAVEEERQQAQQRLALATEEWRSRLEQSAAEHDRAEQVYRERVRNVEVELQAAEQRQAELGMQSAAERARWSEEKANIWAEAKDKESCKIMLLSEKIEHLKEEKSTLENQLSVGTTANQQLQRDNSSLLADLTDLRWKLSAVQEELLSERLLTQKLRSEKTEELRVQESLKSELANSQRAVAEAIRDQEQLRGEIQKLTALVADKERLITAVRKEEKDRASLLVSAIRNYVEQVNATNS